MSKDFVQKLGEKSGQFWLKKQWFEPLNVLPNWLMDLKTYCLSFCLIPGIKCKMLMQQKWIQCVQKLSSYYYSYIWYIFRALNQKLLSQTISCQMVNNNIWYHHAMFSFYLYLFRWREVFSDFRLSCEPGSWLTDMSLRGGESEVSRYDCLCFIYFALFCLYSL